MRIHSCITSAAVGMTAPVIRHHGKGISPCGFYSQQRRLVKSRNLGSVKGSAHAPNAPSAIWGGHSPATSRGGVLLSTSRCDKPNKCPWWQGTEQFPSRCPKKKTPALFTGPRCGAVIQETFYAHFGPPGGDLHGLTKRKACRHSSRRPCTYGLSPNQFLE